MDGLDISGIRQLIVSMCTLTHSNTFVSPRLLILRAKGNCNFLFGGNFEVISHCNVEARQWKFSVLRTLGSTTRVPFSVAAPRFDIALTRLFQITAEAVEELAGSELEAGVFTKRFMSTPPRIMKRSYPEFEEDLHEGETAEQVEAGSDQDDSAADEEPEEDSQTGARSYDARRAPSRTRTEEGDGDVAGQADPDPPSYQDSLAHAQNRPLRPPSPAPSTDSVRQPVPVCAMLFVIYWVGYGKFRSLVDACEMDIGMMQRQARRLLREHGPAFVPRREENNSQECVLDEPSMSVVCKRLVSGGAVLELKETPRAMDVSLSFGELPSFMRVEVEVTGDPKNIPRPGQRRGLFGGSVGEN